MKLWHLLSPALVLLLVALMAPACGGDDGNGSEDDQLTTYLGELSAVAALGNVQIVRLEERFPGVFVEVEPTQQYYTEYIRIYNQFVESARDLTPPDEVADEHEAYVTASDDLLAITQARLEELAGAQGKEDIDAIFAADDEFAEAVAKQDFACSELKLVADDRGIPVPGLQDCNNFD